jgi:hypothetical protein
MLRSVNVTVNSAVSKLAFDWSSGAGSSGIREGGAVCLRAAKGMAAMHGARRAPGRAGGARRRRRPAARCHVVEIIEGLLLQAMCNRPVRMSTLHVALAESA